MGTSEVCMLNAERLPRVSNIRGPASHACRPWGVAHLKLRLVEWLGCRLGRAQMEVTKCHLVVMDAADIAMLCAGMQPLMFRASCVSTTSLRRMGKLRTAVTYLERALEIE
eukprot:2785225-Amphidinium_carterae.1